MTEFFEFLNAPSETFRDVPGTNLEVSNYGRLRNIITKAWYGRIIYQADLEGVTDGSKPVWLKEVVELTDKPTVYFVHRDRDDKQRERALEAEYNRALREAA